MITEDILPLFKTSDRLVDDVSLDFKRYLMPEIDWNNRLICIKGARGAGKTTILKAFVDIARGIAGGEQAAQRVCHVMAPTGRAAMILSEKIKSERQMALLPLEQIRKFLLQIFLLAIVQRLTAVTALQPAQL